MSVTSVAATPLSSLELNLELLNREFDQASPAKILGWCVLNIPNHRLIQTSAFNVDDLVITDILYRELGRPIPVLFLETLHHFPETLELVQKVDSQYSLQLHTYQTPGVNSRAEFAALYGEQLWDTDVSKFHQLTKIEPLQRGLEELQTLAWITGRRRDQAVTRANMPVFELDSARRLKVNPLASWTRADSWAYVAEHHVPYNPLHDRGYASIGDEPLTTPVAPGEDERAGRWRGTGKTECGIHI